MVRPWTGELARLRVRLRGRHGRDARSPDLAAAAKARPAARSADCSAASTSVGDTSPAPSIASITPARELKVTADTLTEFLQPLGIVDETGRLTRGGRRSITLKEALLAPALDFRTAVLCLTSHSPPPEQGQASL